MIQNQAGPMLDDTTQFMLNGPEVRLTERQALPMSIVLHELATNAVKHGALSTRGGGLRVSWSVDSDRGPPLLVLHWDEISTLEIRPPSRDGMGSELIAAAVRLDLRGAVEFSYRPHGLLAVLRVPLATAAPITARPN
jgi:two-component sensor histidine kinase